MSKGLFGKIADMLVGGSGSRTTTEIQDLYNQIAVASESTRGKGGTFRMTDIFSTSTRGNAQSFRYQYLQKQR